MEEKICEWCNMRIEDEREIEGMHPSCWVEHKRMERAADEEE